MSSQNVGRRVGGGPATAAGAGPAAGPGRATGGLLPPRDAGRDPLPGRQRHEVAGHACHFVPWDRVYASFRRWHNHDLVREFHNRLRRLVRERAGRDSEPGAGVIESQSAKTDAVVGSDSRGFNGGNLGTPQKNDRSTSRTGAQNLLAADLGPNRRDPRSIRNGSSASPLLYRRPSRQPRSVRRWTPTSLDASLSLQPCCTSRKHSSRSAQNLLGSCHLRFFRTSKSSTCPELGRCDHHLNGRPRCGHATFPPRSPVAPVPEKHDGPDQNVDASLTGRYAPEAP